MIVHPTAINDWLQTLMLKRSINVPTSQPLYTYQLSEAEFFSLKSLLIKVPYSLQKSKEPGWCAVFCLYGAEWYRRKYLSGWSWSGIFAELGYDIEPNKREDVVVNGLAFWKRTIIQYENGQKSYLGTIFSEGGVPFALLASEGSRFQLMFKRLLTDYDKAKAFGVSTIPFIQQELSRMANAFKEETTVTLLDNMVTKLYELIDGFSLEKQEQPAAYLDGQLPKWRNSFPIPLDNATGEELLSGLLKSAASHRKATNEQRKRVQVAQWLANTEKLQFSVCVELAKKFSIPVGQAKFSNPMVEVLICEGKNSVSRLGLVRAECRDNETIVHLTKTLVTFSRLNWEVSLSIVLMQGGNEIYRESIPYTALLLSDMPLVFEKHEDTLLFVGQGSVSKKASSLLALLPSEAQFSSSIDTTNVLESQVRDGHHFIEFTGELWITSKLGADSDEFSLSTKAEQFSKELLEISGEEIPYESNYGYPVYKGLPDISCYYPDSEVYIGEQKVDQLTYLSDIFGRQVIKVKLAGKTLYRKKIAILPKSFSLHLKAGKTANHGFLYLSCDQRMMSSVQSDVSVSSKKIDNGKMFELTCQSAPPAYVDIQIRANLLAEPIVLQVPFPSKGALFFDANGGLLPRERKLVIDQLLGARAMLFGESNSNNTRFNIELIAPTSSRHAVQEIHTYRVSAAYQEVSLYEFRHKIKELLASTDELDSIVRMVVSSPSCESKQYQIGRYSVSAKREGGMLTFKERDVEDFSEIKVDLINLTDPNEKSRPLAQRLSGGAAIGKFDLPTHLNSPSLAVPAKDSNIPFRAIYIPATHSALNPNKAKSLSKAVTEFHPSTNPRAFDAVLDEMARDLTHSSWSFLDVLFSNYRHLPMVSFEVWKAIAKHPMCLAAFAFVTKHDVEEVIQSMQIELNVLWELLPTSAWKVAENRYCDYLIAKACPEEFLDKRVGIKKKAVASYLGLTELFELTPKKGLMYFALIEMWRTDLLRNKSDHGVIWPDHYANVLYEWLSKNESKLLCFEIPAKFQTAVLLFPIVAAVVTAGKCTWQDVLHGEEPDNVLLRQLMDFDRAWFESIFQCCLCVYSEE